MKIDVVLYGVLKQDAGAKQRSLNLTGDSVTVADVADTLAAQVPPLAARLETVAYVVGDTIVDPGYVLHDGDQLALLPPVSGG